MSRYGTKDSTFGIFTMDDGTMFSMNISWAAPVVWPGAVYGLEIAIIGDRGIIDIEDTHRDLVLASEIAQGAGYAPDGRPEEHKSELQSLMRISYAVFCLKKKNNHI